MTVTLIGLAAGFLAVVLIIISTLGILQQKGVFRKLGGFKMSNMMPSFGRKEAAGVTTSVTKEYEVGKHDLMKALNIEGNVEKVEYKDDKLYVKVKEK